MEPFKHYHEALDEAGRHLTESPHPAIHPAFDGKNKAFTTNNWNDPFLMRIRHQGLAKFRSEPDANDMPTAHLVEEGKQQTLILKGMTRALVLSWRGDYPRIEHLYFLSRPTLPVTFETLVEWCQENRVPLFDDAPVSS